MVSGELAGNPFYEWFRDDLHRQVDEAAPVFFRHILDEVARLHENPPDDGVGRLHFEWPATVGVDLYPHKLERIAAKLRALDRKAII